MPRPLEFPLSEDCYCDADIIAGINELKRQLDLLSKGVEAVEDRVDRIALRKPGFFNRN